MRVFLWHVHGSYTTSLVQGEHTYLIPVLPGRGADGRGRARTWDWPDSVAELTPAQAASAEVDVVILQRPEELYGLAEGWLGGRRPGVDVPAIYLEHNAPQGHIADMRHPAADHDGLVVAHVTGFNQLFWDCGATPTHVIEHGIVDPGMRYSGEIAAAAVVVNEPLRRSRVVGTDLLGRFAQTAPLHVFGMGVAPLSHEPHIAAAFEDLPQAELHEAMARRRVYVHPVRWTSLGLSLLEAMHLGMPVVALATTDVVEAVPPEAGALSTDVDALCRALRRLLDDPDMARSCGEKARAVAVERYGLARFLRDWNALLEEVRR